ncbi:hypothetical protein CDL12_24852 [Handroanthus impetiginosus]|uniref:VASt domain-containing protein n=1 Tax=Handroanthus impetiginosus TaxID=429701 RepID=A0A2G9GBH3_9LAMI|nr:hypothetical protein CDL12_24852 [Handroanthus impetiginosus]
MYIYKIIPFHEITSVRRAKAVAVFPTAIEIIAGGKKYFFTSFLFRDEAFKLINEGWLQHSNGSKEITDQQEGKPAVSSQENGSSTVEESGSSRRSVDEFDISESDKNGPILEESKHFGESENVSTSSIVEVKEESSVEAAPIIECSSSAKSSVWQPEEMDAPGVPEGYTKVVESKFPIRAEEFFNLFFSDDGIKFHESFHRKCGDKDFKCTKWQPHEKFGHTRDLSFQHPIKIYFGARFGSCHEVQKYRVYRNRQKVNSVFSNTSSASILIILLHEIDYIMILSSTLTFVLTLVKPVACSNNSCYTEFLVVVTICCHLIVDTSQEVNDVPYSDYFTVEGRWDAEEDGNDSNPGCILRVYINVAFSKKTMWKGKIVQSTVEECREAYAIWIDLAHEVLKQKNLEKEEGRASDEVLNEQFQLEKQSNDQQNVESRANGVGISQITTHVKDMNQRNTGLPIVCEASVGSLLRDSFAKFSSSLRYQNTPSLLLVITIAIILVLMQISILVLLSRPQRIHVIPQAECMNSLHGMGQNRGEAFASLNRQIKYLKEELHFVETLLEKMQNEHAQLKGKLQDLELFRNQRM